MGLFGPKSPEEERLKELTGGFLVSDEYIAILEGNGLNVTEGENIREKIKKEIKSGSLKTDDILNRLDYLIKKKAKSKGHKPRGYDMSILYPNISALPKYTEDLSHVNINELMMNLPQSCPNCGYDTEGLVHVFCPKCISYLWNPVSDEVFRRMIDEYLKIAELLDNEYHKRLTVVNELKSKGFSIHSIFLTEFCRFVSYLATADNTISDAEVEFINEYFHVNLNRKQINDLAETLDETYVKTLPLPAIIYHEIETEVDNNYQLDHVKNFYGILGDLFVSCDGHVDPKEKIKFGIYLKNLRKNVQNLKAGRYGSIDISRKQQNAIKIIEKHKTKNETKNKMTPTDTCSKCGFKNRPTAKFCTQCGNELI